MARGLLSGVAANARPQIAATDLPKLIKLLKDPDVGKRCQAANQLGCAGSSQALKSAVPALVEALKDSSQKVRLSAIAALGQLGPRAEAAVPALSLALCERQPTGIKNTGLSGESRFLDVSGAVLDALEKIGPAASKALPYVIPYLSERNELWRRDKVLRVLAAIGPDESTAPLIMRVIEEEGRFTQTRRQAIRLLARVHPAPSIAIPLLSSIVKDDPDAIARDDAAKVLEIINKDSSASGSDNPEIVALSNNVLPDKDMDTRLAALRSIQELGPSAKNAVAALIPLLHDCQPAIKLETIDALAAIGPDARCAIPALVADNLCEPSEDKRLRAFRAIARIDPDGTHTCPLLSRALEDPFRARNAVTLLEMIGTEETTARAESAKKIWRLK